MIIGVVAISKDFAIGKDGKLPWHHPADLKFFRATTTGNAVLMGSRTWHSIGKPLVSRFNIVLSRDATLDLPSNVLRLANIESALELSKYLAGDLYVIGGAKVFEAFASHMDQWVVTTVPDDVKDADTFMPSNFLDGFEVRSEQDIGEGCHVRVLHRS